jgi:hypothetical protein
VLENKDIFFLGMRESFGKIRKRLKIVRIMKKKSFTGRENEE